MSKVNAIAGIDENIAAVRAMIRADEIRGCNTDVLQRALMFIENHKTLVEAMRESSVKRENVAYGNLNDNCRHLYAEKMTRLGKTIGAFL